jgi:hypothetical protein
MNETKKQTNRYFGSKPISYHRCLDKSLDAWASECDWDPESLRQTSELAIRTRHHEAIIERESPKARGNRPDVFSLSLGSVQVFYTVECTEVMIRGYGWEIDREPLDDFDGGGFYSETSW